MTNTALTRRTLLPATLLSAAGRARGAGSATWRAGVAAVTITPRQSMWMAGFGARTKPSEGILHELQAKALALEDAASRRGVLVTADILGFPGTVAARIAKLVEKQYGLPRAALVLSATHTHGGPLVVSPRPGSSYWRLNDQQWRDAREYTRELEEEVVRVVGAALNDLRPARLGFGRTTAEFGVNRRKMTDKGVRSFVPNPEGPVDHDVAILRVESPAGVLQAVVFGYACHATALVADTYQFHGDYPGFAQQWLENRHPGARALFVQGCGGDITTHPRGTVELAQKYGDTLAGAVEDAIKRPMTAVHGPLRCAWNVFSVAFGSAPSRDELRDQLEHKDPLARAHARAMLAELDREGRFISQHPYPLQAWQFGDDLTFLAMAGEVVVDYALRLKRELGEDKLWVAAYSNDVFAYIPSLRVLREGGYEGGGSMRAYGLPAPFASDIEERIVGKAHALVRRVRGK